MYTTKLKIECIHPFRRGFHNLWHGDCFSLQTHCYCRLLNWHHATDFCSLSHTFMTLFPTCFRQILYPTSSGAAIALQHYTLFSLLNAISPKFSNVIKCTLCTFCCLKTSPSTEATNIIPSFIFHTTEWILQQALINMHCHKSHNCVDAHQLFPSNWNTDEQTSKIMTLLGSGIIMSSSQHHGSIPA